MNPRVGRDVESRDARTRQFASCLVSDEREHGPMMMGIGVEIEDCVAEFVADPGQEVVVPALADVDDALQHVATLPSAARDDLVGRCYPDRMFAGFFDGPEVIVVLVVILVLFGGSQIPKLARNLGQAQKEFKKGLADGSKADDDSTKSE